MFLPGFKAVHDANSINKHLPALNLELIDHVVGNQDWNQMGPVEKFYVEKLGFKRFWSFDDKQIHTEYSALRSVVMIDQDHTITMPINEPAEGKRKSQIQEFVEYFGGPGAQHIALKTSDIIYACSELARRGVEFQTVPPAYYEDLKKRLAHAPHILIKEDMQKLQDLSILVDFDDQGYLLQIFTKPVEDRPTLFFEIIQRHNNNGFGAGNFKALFESIERDQEKRGNL